MIQSIPDINRSDVLSSQVSGIRTGYNQVAVEDPGSFYPGISLWNISDSRMTGSVTIPGFFGERQGYRKSADRVKTRREANIPNFNEVVALDHFTHDEDVQVIAMAEPMKITRSTIPIPAR